MKNKFQSLIAQRITNRLARLSKTLLKESMPPNLIAAISVIILAVLILSLGVNTWVNAQQSPTVPRNQVEIERLLEDFGQGGTENFFITLPKEEPSQSAPFAAPNTQASPTPPPPVVEPPPVVQLPAPVEPPPIEEVPLPPVEIFKPEPVISNKPIPSIPSFPPPDASIVPSDIAPIPILESNKQPLPPTIIPLPQDAIPPTLENPVPPTLKTVPPILLEKEDEISKIVPPKQPINKFQTQIYPPSRYASPPLKRTYRNPLSPPRYPNIPTPPNQSEITEKEKLPPPENTQEYTFELPPQEVLPPETRPDQILLEGLAGTLQSNVHVTPPFEQSYLDDLEDPRLTGKASPLDKKLAEQGLPPQEALALKSIIETPEEEPVDEEPSITFNEQDIISRYVEPLFAERYRDTQNLQRIVNAQALPEDPPTEKRERIKKKQSDPSPTIITLPPSIANNNTPEQQLSEEELIGLLLQARRYALIKRYSEALFLLRFVQVRQPENVVMLNMKGSIYYKINRLEMALAYWKRSLNLNPYQPLVIAYEQRLENYLFQLREQLTDPGPTSSG